MVVDWWWWYFFLLTYLSKCIDIVKIKDYLVHVMNKGVADRELT